MGAHLCCSPLMHLTSYSLINPTIFYSEMTLMGLIVMIQLLNIHTLFLWVITDALVFFFPQELFCLSLSSSSVNSLSALQNCSSVLSLPLFYFLPSVPQGFDQLRIEGLLCDVTLVAGDGDEAFPVHRAMMASSSDYFKAMFTGE